MKTPTSRAGGSDLRRARLYCRAVAALPALLASLAIAAPAQAASLPSASTGHARNVSFGSALLTGTVNPQGSDTSYYFQYGVTRAYGAQSTIADAGAGKGSLSVAVPISGLQPVTVYHYRLVAVNAAGATIGSDATFLTTKIPLSLQIVSSPNPQLFGGPVVVQGVLSGTGNANRVVVLQADAFPFTAGFVNIGNPELTHPDGGFLFTLLSLGVTTQFRVVTTTNQPIASPVTTENVAALVSTRTTRLHRHRVRIFGTVTPAQDGLRVGFVKFSRGRTFQLAVATLHHRSASSSAFSRVLHLTPGVYRVFVPANGGLVAGFGAPVVIR